MFWYRADTAAGRSAQSQRGLTLLEMVIFIVLLGVLGAALLTAFVNPLSGAGTQQEAVFLTHLAQERMELVLGQKRREGFPGSDPCDAGASLAACTEPSGYTVNSDVNGAWSENGDTDNYRLITVTATGPDGGSYTVSTLVALMGDG